MENVEHKIVTIQYLTHNSGAYADVDDGHQCYIPVNMRNSVDVRVGDKYQATVKLNYDNHIDKVRYIALRLYPDHENTILIDDEDDEEIVGVTSKFDVTPEIELDDVDGDPAPRTLSEMRDQMFRILLDMDVAELSDMIIEVLSQEPMGFVDTLWSLLSISPIRVSDMSETQRKCYDRVRNRCSALHKEGKLVEAKYTTMSSDGTSHVSVIYAVTQRQVDPTLD